MSWTQHLTGELNQRALKQAIEHVVDRHDALRTIFPGSGESCQPEVLSNIEIPLPVVDLRRTETGESVADELKHQCESEAGRRFDLTKGPLLRAILYRLGEDEHVLLFVFHHTIIDATSALNVSV